jgi:cystathionine gamma-lyase
VTELGPSTRAVRAGLPAAADGEPFLPGPVLAAPFHVAGDPQAAPYGYHRYGNPTWTRYEAALGELEGGEAVVFASGMAAVTAVLVPALRPGDVLVAPSDGYPGVRSIARDHLAARGVEVRLVPTDDGAVHAALEGATLVWIETPSNPGLDVLDIARIADAAHRAGAVVAVDNTLATPLAQRPLDLGADISVSSASKYLTGHSDLVMGHAAVRDPERAEALRRWRGLTGAIPGPFETWLAHRSLATLAVRLERQTANAQALARALRSRDDVRDVRHPAVGAVICFELPDAAAAQRFLASCELVVEATSFGGVHSTAERRARWGTDAVGEGFIRFSAGIEDPQDLIADVAQALDRAAGA